MTRTICYKKLWKLLIDRGFNKVELQRQTGIFSVTITKMVKSETINTHALILICNALNCDTSDIMERANIEDAQKGLMIRL